MQVRPDVAAAVARGDAVVALETTLIAHGLPRPQNLEVANELESIVRLQGAVPATVGVVGGEPVVGLDDAGLRLIAGAERIPKLSQRDLAVAAALGSHGATTVASTAHLAALAGVRVFATGGLGGVHRNARDTWDESADLLTLSQTPVIVVCAGVKSILDVAATIERLETLNVTVVGFKTRHFPLFYLSTSSFSLDWCIENEEEAARVYQEQRRLGLSGALIVLNPIPAEAQLDPALHERVLQEGLAAVQRADVVGKAVTPFLLDYFHTATGGESLNVNTRIVRANARLAGRIAVALAHS